MQYSNYLEYIVTSRLCILYCLIRFTMQYSNYLEYIVTLRLCILYGLVRCYQVTSFISYYHSKRQIKFIKKCMC